MGCSPQEIFRSEGQAKMLGRVDSAALGSSDPGARASRRRTLILERQSIGARAGFTGNLVKGASPVFLLGIWANIGPRKRFPFKTRSRCPLRAHEQPPHKEPPHLSLRR